VNRKFNDVAPLHALRDIQEDFGHFITKGEFATFAE